MTASITVDSARNLLRDAASSSAALHSALMLGCIMREFAVMRGYEDSADIWEAAGLLHFLARQSSTPMKKYIETGADEEFLDIISEGEVDMTGVVIRKKGQPRKSLPAPKKLTQEDELRTCLVVLDHLMTLIETMTADRPKRSVKGIKVSAVKKKFEDRRFNSAVSRSTILDGAKKLSIEIGILTSKTLHAMEENEARVKELEDELQLKMSA